ncbi:MAG: hypothetical protein ACE5IM_02455 [Nitrospinota bacterium]
MDWSLFKGVLEGFVLLVLLPGTAYYLFHLQRRQIEEKARQLEAQRRRLDEKDRAIRGLEADLAAERERFHAFRNELLARNNEAWSRFLEEESALVQSAQEKGVGALQDQFEGFRNKLTRVQEDLEQFRQALVGTFQTFYDQRRKALETRGTPAFLRSEWVAEMRVQYREGPSGTIRPRGNGSTLDEPRL